VIGDSLSAGVGDASPGYASLGWSDRVADVLRRVRPDLSYLNTAEIGSTTARAVDSQMERVLAFAPDRLHLPCGANDIIRREPAFDEIERTLRRMYEVAARTGAQLTTFTLGKAYIIPTVPDWLDRVRKLNDVTRRLAADHGAVVVDMWDYPLNERDNLLSADRIHFSASGEAVTASEMITELACKLDRAPDPPTAVPAKRPRR
jgi:lysophospholipase L1-like esterase